MSKKILDNFFSIILILLLGITLFSMHPFMRYPYDIFAHLITIDELYHHLPHTTTIPENRLLWHGFWANIFQLLHIDSKQLFLRTRIIFIVQMIFNLLAVYFFSLVVLRHIFHQTQKHDLYTFALWSTLIWFIIFATQSGFYHLVWAMWYGVNYQISLGMFWYITALSIILLFEQPSPKKQLFIILQIILFSYIILQIHAMEFLYYLMYMSLLFLLYIERSIQISKKYYYLLPLIPLAIYGLLQLPGEHPKIIHLLSSKNIPELYHTILNQGQHIVTRFSRISSSINELMYLAGFMTILMILHLLWHYSSLKQRLNVRFFFFIVISSLFVLIPVFTFTAGLFAFVTRPDVIHRFYYSSSIYLLLPISMLYLYSVYRLKKHYIHLILGFALFATAFFSKHSIHASHNFYKNIRSIGYSIQNQKYQFHLNQKHIQIIGQKLDEYEKKYANRSKSYFYARSDIAFVLKYIYHKEVYWEGRRANPNHIEQFKRHQAPSGYIKILFETPDQLPPYKPYL